MRKAIFIKILAILVHVIPVVIAIFIKGGVLIRSPHSTISLIALFSAIILALIFKNYLKNIFVNFGAFGFSLISFGLCLIFLAIGEPLLGISGASLIGGIFSIPLHIGYAYLTRPVTETTYIKTLKDLIRLTKDVDNE